MVESNVSYALGGTAKTPGLLLCALKHGYFLAAKPNLHDNFEKYSILAFTKPCA